MVNNKLTIIHPKAFSSLMKLQRLYLSRNLLKEVPANMPKSLQELRIHENAITKIKKSSFQGMANLIVVGKERRSVGGGGCLILIDNVASWVFFFC